MKKRSHERAEDKRTITISIEKEVVDQIDILSESENRTRSNWIVTELKKLVAQKMAGKKLLSHPDVSGAGEQHSRQRNANQTV